MRILFVAHRLPFPLDKGDKIRAGNILRHLANRNEVHLAALIDDPADYRHVGLAKQYAKTVSVASIHRRPRSVSAIGALLTGRSITQVHFYHRRLQRKIDELASRLTFDMVYCSSSATADYVFRSSADLASVNGRLLIMDLIDIDSVKWRQYAQGTVWPLSYIYRRESDRLAALERKVHRNFDSVAVVSGREAALFPGDTGRKPVVAISNGVDADYFQHMDRHVTPDTPNLVFVGMMNYRPNIEGMRWFIEAVFPKVRAEVPTCTLTIVGGKPDKSVQEWNSIEGVSVTGFVEDVRQYLRGASISVIPLQIARGIQNKVLEAMAMGLPIVATPEAIDGIDLVDGEHVISETDADAFARTVADLLRDPERAERLGAAARRHVESKYLWPRQLEVLDTLIADLQQGVAPLTTKAT